MNSGSWTYCTVKTSWVPAWSDYPDKKRFFKSWLAEWPGTGEYDHWVEKWYLLFIMVMKVELTQEALVDSVVLWMVVCFIGASGFQSLACMGILSTGAGSPQSSWFSGSCVGQVMLLLLENSWSKLRAEHKLSVVLILKRGLSVLLSLCQLNWYPPGGRNYWECAVVQQKYHVAHLYGMPFPWEWQFLQLCGAYICGHTQRHWILTLEMISPLYLTLLLKPKKSSSPPRGSPKPNPKIKFIFIIFF